MLTFNSVLTELTQKDQYPTDEIYEGIFNFTSKASAIEYFEILGYEGANFITMSGSVLINIMIPLVTYALHYILLKLTYRFKKVSCMKKLGSKIQQISIAGAILPLFIAGYLEIMFCAITALKGLESADFDGENKSDLFAAIFLIVCSLILASLPIVSVYVLRKYKNKLDDPEIEEKYGPLYNGLRIDCFWSSMFNVFFMMRRTIFALIIIQLYELKGIQQITNMYLSMVMLMYVAHFRPYRISSANDWEIFNEVSGIMVQYFLMWLAIFPPIDVSQVSILSKVGFMYIFAVSSNLTVNFLYVGVK